MTSLLFAGLASLAVTTGSRRVLAQDESPDGEITPPRSINAGHAPYPSNAHGDAEVILIVVVGTDGRVREAEIIGGKDPFAVAAREAAGGWTFEPARRQGEAVAARIRMRVSFEEPLPEVSPSKTASTPANPSAPPQEPDREPDRKEPEEVFVRGDTSDPVRTVISPEETRRIPGAFGDPFRAVEAYPGVTAIASGLPYFFVRSAPPGNTGYFFDDIQVPTLYHVGLGPGVLPPDLVGNVDLHLGAAPARFGRVVGGIVAAESRAPPSQIHGAAIVRLYDVGGYAEIPFEEARATALVGGRYSVAGPLLGLVTKDVRMAYWDYQARATWEPPLGGRVTLLAFGSHDVLEQRDDETRLLRQSAGGEFHRIDLRYDRDDGGDGHFQMATTVGIDTGAASKLEGSNQRIQTRLRVDRRLSGRVRTRFGADFTHDSYKLASTAGPNDTDETFLATLSRSRDELNAGLWADVSLHTDTVDLTPGLRIDRYETRRTGVDPTFTVEPRLSARAPLSANLAALLSMGVAHQRPSYFIPVYGISPLIRDAPLQAAYQMSQGAEIKLPLRMNATATGFYHVYTAMTDASFTCGGDLSYAKHDGIGCLTRTVDGRAFGAELSLRRSMSERVGGILSYTLSRAIRMSDTLGDYDRPQVLSAVLSFDWGAGYVTGVRFLAYSGHPYSRTIDAPNGAKVPIAPFNRDRLEAFYRLDVRAEKRFAIGKHLTGAVVIEGLNVLFRKEAYAIDCNPAGSVCTPKRLGPLTIPNIALELRF